MGDNKTYILSFDQGTTSSRTVLFDERFRIVGIEQQEIQQFYPRPGWVEQDPVEILEAQLFVLRKLIHRLGIEPSSIASLGITNQRETTVVWNRHSGKPVYNAIIWQDRRTADYCNYLKSIGMEEIIKQKTGLVIDSYFSATKLRWILESVDGVRKSAENGDLLFGTIDTWLIWNLTGGKRHITDVSNASRTMMFDINKLCWDNELLDIFDIPSAMLPEVVASSGTFGIAKTGLTGKGNIEIGGIAGDQQAALFGQACFDEGMVKNTYGTGCFMLLNTGSKPCNSQNGLLSTVAWKVNDSVVYAAEGSVFIAGAAVKWLRDGIHLIRDAAETNTISQSLSDSGDIFVVPAFAGLGAPYWDMKARGAILGITQGVTEKHIVRATLESLAYQTRDVLEAMQQSAGVTIKILKADGGASANNYLMQFQSDMLQIDVVRPEIIESTALGAAYLAAISAGMCDLKSISEMWQQAHVFSPSMPEEKREALYRKWKKAVSRCMNWED
ncbi:MAG TPA: glycerol kinase GlpK [Bacteroidales bacterium]|nr:glycerol kinase GlpK [Bacteroidales bacterium]